MKLFGGKLFCKHNWEFDYRIFNGNEKQGYEDVEYGFRCIKCKKIKKVKVGK